MKNILVPTDFSECAVTAIKTAAMFAKEFGSKVHLVNAQDLPPYWDNLPKEEKQKWAVVDKANTKSKNALAQIQLEYPSIEIVTSTTSDNPLEATTRYIAENGIDLVVMGTHGVQGKKEFFVGSNAQKVVRAIHCPCLVLKKPMQKLAFRKVVYASNFAPSEMESFLVFKKIIKHFLPEIHLVTVNKSLMETSGTKELKAMQPFEKACIPLFYHSHIFNDISIERGIRSLANKIDADLIVISNHERHTFKRNLIGSNVEALLNHSELPVLTIDYS